MNVVRRILPAIVLIGLLVISGGSIASASTLSNHPIGVNHQSPLLTSYSSGSNPSSPEVAWRSTVYGMEPGPGCWQVEYPSTTWTSVSCVSVSGQPPTEQIGGSGATPDDVAASTYQYIDYSTGSFSMESNFGSESDNSYGSNAYSLQMNTNTFTCTISGHTLTNGCWQQFILLNCSCSGVGSSYYHTIFIEYWLLGYYSTYSQCPTPGLVSWTQNGSNCEALSSVTSTGSQSPANLDSYSLTGGTIVSGSAWDNMQFCNSSYCYSVVVSGTVLNAGSGWVDSEFNIFGANNGSQAQFTPTAGNTFSVYDAVLDYSPYGNTSPTCSQTTFTGESNNMYLGTGGNACSASGVTNIVFYEYT